MLYVAETHAMSQTKSIHLLRMGTLHEGGIAVQKLGGVCTIFLHSKGKNKDRMKLGMFPSKWQIWMALLIVMMVLSDWMGLASPQSFGRIVEAWGKQLQKYEMSTYRVFDLYRLRVLEMVCIDYSRISSFRYSYRAQSLSVYLSFKDGLVPTT